MEEKKKHQVNALPLLELYLQRNVTNQIQQMDEKVIANAIKSLLRGKEDIPKHYH